MVCQARPPSPARLSTEHLFARGFMIITQTGSDRPSCSEYPCFPVDQRAVYLSACVCFYECEHVCGDPPPQFLDGPRKSLDSGTWFALAIVRQRDATQRLIFFFLSPDLACRSILRKRETRQDRNFAHVRGRERVYVCAHYQHTQTHVMIQRLLGTGSFV